MAEDELTPEEQRSVAALTSFDVGHRRNSEVSIQDFKVDPSTNVSPREMGRTTDAIDDLRERIRLDPELRRKQGREDDRIRFATSTRKRIGRVFGLGKSVSGVIREAVAAEGATAGSIARTIEDGAKVFQVRSEGVHSVNRAVAAVGTLLGWGELVTAIRNSRSKDGRVGTEQGDITRHLRNRGVEKAIKAAYAAVDTDHQRGIVGDAVGTALKNINARLPDKSKIDPVSVDPHPGVQHPRPYESDGHSWDDHQLAELTRVKNASTRARGVARTLGIGKSARNVVHDAVRSADASTATVKQAMDYKARTTFARSMISTIPERIISLAAGVWGVGEANRLIMGMPTRQGNITRDLKIKAHERAVNTVLKAADKYEGNADIVRRAIDERVGERERARGGRGR